jgi:hypothetical protein
MSGIRDLEAPSIWQRKATGKKVRLIGGGGSEPPYKHAYVQVCLAGGIVKRLSQAYFLRTFERIE